MGNLGKVLLQSGIAFLLVGSIYTGEVTELNVKMEQLRNTRPVIGLNTVVDPSERDFTNIFGQMIDFEESDPEIYYIPLKNSEVTLIKVDGKNVLINTGESEDSKELHSFLVNAGVDKIDYMIITLPEVKNIGGAGFFVSNMEVDKIYMPLVNLNDNSILSFLTIMQQKEKKLTKVDIGDIIEIGRSKIEVLNIGNVDNVDIKDKNESSFAFLFEFRNKKFLFSGDIKKEKQKNITWPDVDVLKLENHGADEYSSKELVENSKPEYIISTETNEKKIDQNILNLLNIIEKDNITNKHFSTPDEIVVVSTDGEEILVKTIPNTLYKGGNLDLNNPIINDELNQINKERILEEKRKQEEKE